MKQNPFTIWTKPLPPGRQLSLLNATVTIGGIEFDAVCQPGTTTFYLKLHLPERKGRALGETFRIRK